MQKCPYLNSCNKASHTLGQAYFFFIEFIEVILVNKIIWVSDVQFYNTLAVCCTVCSPPQLKSPSFTIYSPLPSSTFPHLPSPLVITILLSVSMSFFSLLNASTFSPSPIIPFLSDLFSKSMSLSLFCLLIYFVYQILHVSEIIQYLSLSD